MLSDKINPYPSFRWFMGTIVDRNDPLKLGRCRVRVFGVHTDNKNKVPTQSLPWATVMRPVSDAANSGISGPVQLVEGTTVVGFFSDGESAQVPIIMGTLAGIPENPADPTDGFVDERPTETPSFDGQLTLKDSPRQVINRVFNNVDQGKEFDPSGGNQIQEENGELSSPGDVNSDGYASRYPREELLNQPDTPGIARGDSSADITQCINDSRQQGIPTANDNSWSQPSNSYISTFPFNKVFSTESGHAISLDDSPGSENIQVFHRTGSYVQIGPDGTFIQNSFKDNFTLVARNQKVHVDGCSDTTIDKGMTLFVNADMEKDTSVNHDLYMRAGGEANFNIIVDGAADVENATKLNIKVKQNGGIAISVNNGDISINQTKGNIVIVQQNGDTRHTILNGNYGISIPNGSFTVVARDMVSLQSNTGISLMKTGDSNLQGRLLITDDVILSGANAVNILAGSKINMIIPESGTMNPMISVSDRVLIVGPSGVTAQSAATSKTLV